MKKWTHKKIAALIRRLNRNHGQERYMHHNEKVYAHERRTDTYIFICNEEDVDMLLEMEA